MKLWTFHKILVLEFSSRPLFQVSIIIIINSCWPKLEIGQKLSPTRVLCHWYYCMVSAFLSSKIQVLFIVSFRGDYDHIIEQLRYWSMMIERVKQLFWLVELLVTRMVCIVTGCTWQLSNSVFFKFLSSRSFVKSRRLWVHLLHIFRLVKQWK